MIEVQDHIKKQGRFYDKISEVSDGYHTFGELYEYRMIYNALFVNTIPDYCHKSWRHSDGELCFGKDNYFVVVMQLPNIGQVTNHYKGQYWDLFKIDERERAAEWDEHTPEVAKDRLLKYLKEQ